METEISLPCSQKPTTGPYPEPASHCLVWHIVKLVNWTFIGDVFRNSEVRHLYRSNVSHIVHQVSHKVYNRSS
jgi:hypothetical protein